MVYPSFPIPKDTTLIPDEELDLRSDAEIVSSLKIYYEPNSSEKNVWAYWHTGKNPNTSHMSTVTQIYRRMGFDAGMDTKECNWMGSPAWSIMGMKKSNSTIIHCYFP